MEKAKGRVQKTSQAHCVGDKAAGHLCFALACPVLFSPLSKGLMFLYTSEATISKSMAGYCIVQTIKLMFKQ